MGQRRITSQAWPTRTELVADGGVVATGHPEAAAAGVELLAAGGTAVDALVGAAFAAFVLEPWNCGPGGYGIAAAYLAAADAFVSVDHHLRAPARAHERLYPIAEDAGELEYGWPRAIGASNEWDALSVGVPGAVAGLCVLQERGGRLPLAEVTAPAVRLARTGIPVSWELQLSVVSRLDEIRRVPETAAWLLRGGEAPPRVDERLDGDDLARTLERIGREGPDAFYRGEVADAIARQVAARGGILDAADLAAYRPRVLDETPLEFAGHAYVTANDQLGYEALNLVEALGVLDLPPDSAEAHHLMAEALGHAFVDSLTHCSDPDVRPSPLAGLSSTAFAARRAADIRRDLAADRPLAAGDPWPFDNGRPGGPSAPSSGGARGTSLVAAADAEGNVAALCTTISDGFGSLVLVPGTGIVLNDGMRNFDPRPGLANSVRPGAMPLFGAPVVVAARHGRGTFACAGSGGYRILTGVVHTAVHRLGRGLGLQRAVDQPRVHCQGRETCVDARIEPHVREQLRRLGHDVVVQEERPGWTSFGRIGAVARDEGTGRLVAASGPAWSTAAAGLERLPSRT